MKTPILAFCFCLLTTFVFADVDRVIVTQGYDNNGNIIVCTEYKTDGKVVESQYTFKDGSIYNVAGKKIAEYSQGNPDGKQLYCTRYNKRNFLKEDGAIMTQAEIDKYIADDLARHEQELIKQGYDTKAAVTFNQLQKNYNRQANEDFVNSSFPTLIGKKHTTKETIEYLDTDNDGELDKEIKLKSDGTKTEKPYTPIIIPQ